MNKRTAWIVTGALGVIGAAGGALAASADLGDTDLGDGVNVNGTIDPTTSAAPSVTPEPTGSVATDPATVDPGSAVTAVSVPTPAVPVSASSPVAPDDPASAQSAASAGSGD